MLTGTATGQMFKLPRGEAYIGRSQDAAVRLVACDPGMDYQLRIKDRPVAEGGAVMRKGRLVMPRGPGLGLTVDEKLVRRLSRRG